MDALPEVTLYTDGACSGNPGPGGYGAILRYTGPSGKVYEREYSEGFLETTNNRMELLAVCIGLEALTKACTVSVYSDSRYVCDAVNQGWIHGWVRQNFRRGKSGEVKNIDLWERLIADMKPHRIRFNWVKGHAGNEFNERCDRLAVSAYRKLEQDKTTG